MDEKEAAISTRRVLLVEDEVIIALSTAQRLSREGYDVQIASTGEHALELVSDPRSPHFDLILMDIDLGSGNDGVETARRILAFAELPIVFLTSHTEREYVERVREVTRYGYVLKSSEHLILRLSIETAIDLFNAVQLARRQKRELETIYDHTPISVFVVDSEARVIRANRCAAVSARAAIAAGRTTTLGSVMDCVHAKDDPDACGCHPECGACQLRALVRDTLDTGSEHEGVVITLRSQAESGSYERCLRVSTAPLEHSGAGGAVVFFVDIDQSAHTGSEANHE